MAPLNTHVFILFQNASFLFDASSMKTFFSFWPSLIFHSGHHSFHRYCYFQEKRLIVSFYDTVTLCRISPKPVFLGHFNKKEDMSYKFRQLVSLSQFYGHYDYPFNLYQLVETHNYLKHVGYYTFQLIDDICWIFPVFQPHFSFHTEYHLFIFNFNQLRSLSMFKLFN